MQLISRGIELHKAGKITFYPINTRAGRATTVFYFPAEMYAEFEAIKDGLDNGTITKDFSGSISLLHIILCLLEAGFQDVTGAGVGMDVPFEYTNLDAEKEERLADQMAVNTDRF